MEPDAVADAVALPFEREYYRIFQTNRASMAGLYRDNSVLNFEGERFFGREDILRKLSSHSFGRIHHEINTVDSVSAGPPGDVIVLVKGMFEFIEQDGQLYAVDFSQTFQLTPTLEGGFYILNDLFRWGMGTLP